MNHISPSRSTVLTLHPDPLVRAGIESSLRHLDAFEVLDDSPDPASLAGRPVAVVIADLHQAMRLTEAAGPGVRRSFATARIMVVTSSDREEDIRRAIAAGIHGYVLLGGPVSEFVEGVTALANGGRYLGRSVAERMADSLTRASLTSRESEVLHLVAAGECNKAIARRLRIATATVKTHMNAILGKLSATSRTQAAAIAVKRGLVEERMPIPLESIAPRIPRNEPMAQPA